MKSPFLPHSMKRHGVKETQKQWIRIWPLFLCSISNHHAHQEVSRKWCQHWGWETWAVRMPKVAAALPACSDQSGHRALGLWPEFSPLDFTITDHMGLFFCFLWMLELEGCFENMDLWKTQVWISLPPCSAVQMTPSLDNWRVKGPQDILKDTGFIWMQKESLLVNGFILRQY